MVSDSDTKRDTKRPRAKRLLLSWPKPGNGRRAVVGKSPIPCRKNGDVAQRSSRGRFVHTSYWDMEMHYHLTNLSPNRHGRPILHVPLPWNSLESQIVSNQYLFEYFQHAASQSLSIFGHNPKNVGDILIRAALSSNTASATAVLQSLLALSSLHRYGVQSHAAELKISALKSLAAASAGEIGTVEAIQHVCAGMLLCSFEVHRATCTSGQWAWYVRGVKEVIQIARLSKLSQDSDLITLLDWVHYHEVLARFTFRHWYKGTKDMITAADGCRGNGGYERQEMLNDTRLFGMGYQNLMNTEESAPTYPALELLSAVCDAIPERPPDIHSIKNLHEYKGFFEVLDWRIRSFPAQPTADDITDNTVLVEELFRLAILVYLHRVTADFISQAARTQQYVDRAFEIFTQLGSCERQFPVVILGCEARTDEQRQIVLDLIARTKKRASSRSFRHARLLLQASWCQEDLSGGTIDYWDKLTTIISSCLIMPTFV